MNIAVNTRLLLLDKLEGIGWFTYETLKRITVQHPEHNFIFLFDRKFSGEFVFGNNVKPVVVSPQARHPVLWYLFFEYGIPSALKKHKADLFLSPDGWLSLKTNVKSHVVMHDLNFEHYPEFIPYHVRKYYHYFFPRFAKKAARIATVSEFTKQDIVKKYEIKDNLIDVVYNGANESYISINDEAKKIVKDKYTKGFPFFLFVGLVHPRKNITNLLKSFELFKKSNDNNIKLLIVGEKKWWTKDMQDVYNNTPYKDDIVFTGRLAVNELKNVVASALAMLYVSFFEGFGIPILEAFYCDTPVITSNISSMPEVANDAALLIDPFSVNSICDAMKKIATDENLRKNLILKGQTRKNEYSWQKTADKLWNSIEKTMNV